MWVNCWYKMQRLPIFHMSHRVCAKHPSPKISKTRPFAQALITSPNGKPDKLTPMRETFLGKSWQFSYIYLGRLILRLWSPPFKLQRMSKKFHFWTSQIKTAKISSKKNTLVKAEQLRPKGTDLKAKHQKQKNESAVTVSSGRTIAADVWFNLCRAHLIQDFQGKCFLRSFPGTAKGYGWWRDPETVETEWDLLMLSTKVKYTMRIYMWLVVSTPLKDIRQNGNLPQIGWTWKIFETTTQICKLNQINQFHYAIHAGVCLRAWLHRGIMGKRITKRRTIMS